MQARWHSRLCSQVLATIALAAGLSAQTFVVDAANGPGTDYTSISAAVAAVPDGSTVLVRPGVYGRFRVTGKGLRLLGGIGVIVTNTYTLPASIEVDGTTSNQTIVLSGFQLATSRSVIIHDCAGPVIVEGLSHDALGFPDYGAFLLIQRCAQVSLRDVQFTKGTLSILDSDAVVEASTILAPGAYYSRGNGQSASPALTLTNGAVQVSECTFAGGWGNSLAMPPLHGDNCEAIVSSNTDLRVLAPSTLLAGAGPTVPSVPVIRGGRIVQIDPSVQLVTSFPAAISGAATLRIAPLPAVSAHSGPLGGVLSAEARAPAGTLAILVLGLPGAPTVLSGVSGELWIDPAAYFFIAFGVLQNGAPLVGTAAVPSNPAFLGVRLEWQSVAAIGSGLVASNPSFSLVR